MKRISALFLATLFLPLLLAACSEEPGSPVGPTNLTPAVGEIEDGSRVPGTFRARGPITDAMQQILDKSNLQLAADGSDLRVAAMEWVSIPESNEVGNTVYFGNVGNKRLGIDWVPNDPRRVGPAAGDQISYIVDQSEGNATGGLSSAVTEAAIDRSFATWESQNCSEIGLTKVPDIGVDPSIIDGLYGFGPFGVPQAQITHAGWVNGVFPGGVLAVTFTLVWADNGDPTDIDNNGQLDAAIREIYYNNDNPWGIDTGFPFDVETIALHENGHGLSQGHFGKLFQTDANGKFHFAPRSVMNAGYTGAQQNLKGSDRAGHCGLWANWPNN